MVKYTILLFLSIASSCFFSPLSFAASIGPVDGNARVSATIPGTSLPQITPSPGISPTPTPPDQETKRFSLFGYTSPDARVTIQNPGAYAEVFADKEGYFIFPYLFASFYTEDICIVAHDTEKRTTAPVCVPPPDQNTTEIGPVLLPPSTSISAGTAYVGDSITLSGQTIPNTDVTLSLFTDETKQGLSFNLIPSTYAYTVPSIHLASDANGNYSISLPTSGSQFFRMFTRALYQKQPTPKSIMLVLDIYPFWLLFLKFFSSLFSILFNHLIEILILAQLYIITLIFMRNYFKPHFISKFRSLALRQVDLAIYPHSLLVQKKALMRS